MNRHSFDVFAPKRVVEERESDRVVEMHMRQEDVERAGAYQITCAKQSGTGIEDDSVFRDHHARRLAFLVGVIPGGSKKVQFHDWFRQWQNRRSVL